MKYIIPLLLLLAPLTYAATTKPISDEVHLDDVPLGGDHLNDIHLGSVHLDDVKLQPEGQSTAQPVDQPATEPEAQPATQPAVQPAAQPVAQPAAQPAAQSTPQPAAQSVVEPELQPIVESPPAKIYGGLVLPQVRTNTLFNTTSDAICGGTNKEKVHFITTQEVNTEFKWYIQTPFLDSYCSLRITENVDQNNDSAYEQMFPYGSSDIREDGFFPCGRVAGTESIMVDIPDDIDCDTCVVEWIWKGPGFTVRQCADISVLGGKGEALNCVGQCQNGGICQRGVCVCPAGYTGKYCEHEPGALAKTAKKVLVVTFFVILAVIIVLLIIMCLYWVAQKKISKGEKEQIFQSNRKYMEFDVEMPKQPAGVERPAEHARAESQNEY